MTLAERYSTVMLLGEFLDWFANQQYESVGSGRWYDDFEDGEFTSEHIAKKFLGQRKEEK
jgi:hypothetical protein